MQHLLDEGRAAWLVGILGAQLELFLLLGCQRFLHVDIGLLKCGVRVVFAGLLHFEWQLCGLVALVEFGLIYNECGKQIELSLLLFSYFFFFFFF